MVRLKYTFLVKLAAVILFCFFVLPSFLNLLKNNSSKSEFHQDEAVNVEKPEKRVLEVNEPQNNKADYDFKNV